MEIKIFIAETNWHRLAIWKIIMKCIIWFDKIHTYILLIWCNQFWHCSLYGKMVIIIKKYNWRPHVRFIYWDLPPLVKLSRGCTLERRMSNLMTKITTTKTLSLGNNQWDLTTSGTNCFYTASIQLSVQPDLLCSWSIVSFG